MATDDAPRAVEWGPPVPPPPPPNAPGSTGEGPPATAMLVAGPPTPLYGGIVVEPGGGGGPTEPPPLPGGPPPRCIPGCGTTGGCECWEECGGSDESVVVGPAAPADGAVLETIVTEDVLLLAADDAEEEDADEDELLLELELVFGVIGRTFCWAAEAAATIAAAACCCWAAAIRGDGSRSDGRPVGPLLVGPAPSGGCNRASINPRPMSVWGMGVRAGCSRGDRFGEVTDGGR
uniref:Uncharacterized protein n=1 Tax=Anopheles maculatus TaxID=74869 RepID=A0A182S890_9DIPT